VLRGPERFGSKASRVRAMRLWTRGGEPPLLGGDVDDGLVLAATAGRGDDAEPTLRVMDASGQRTVCLHVHLLRRRGLATC